MISERLRRELNRTDSRFMQLQHLAEENRTKATQAEQLLSQRLPNYVFQQPLLDYIVDFFHGDSGACVEIDGPYHWKQFRKDKSRDLRLYRELGVCTFRIASQVVETDIDRAVEAILSWKPTQPIPLDNRPIDRKAKYKLDKGFDDMMLRWQNRCRADVVADCEFLRFLSQEGFEAQERFMKKLDRRITYWPVDGYR